MNVAESEVMAVVREWIRNFNEGNLEHCVSAYTPDAVMNAKPFGTFTGQRAIGAYWKLFIESDTGELAYRNVKLQSQGENTVHLTGEWTTNNGRGLVLLEIWVKQNDGSWRIVSDNYEVTHGLQEKPSNRGNG